MQCPKCGFEKSGRSCLRCIRNMQQVERAKFLDSLKVGLTKVGATTTGSTKIDTEIVDSKKSFSKTYVRRKRQKPPTVQVTYEVYVLGTKRHYVFKTMSQAEKCCDNLITEGRFFMMQRTEVLAYRHKSQAAIADLIDKSIGV